MTLLGLVAAKLMIRRNTFLIICQLGCYRKIACLPNHTIAVKMKELQIQKKAALASPNSFTDQTTILKRPQYTIFLQTFEPQ